MTNGNCAYAGGDFEYDVFLSYAWVNNDEMGLAGKWVSELRSRLGATLNERLGRSGKSKVFFDVETLGKNLDFGPEIEDALRRSAAFVAVISKGYIESPNCREEMRFFEDQVVRKRLSKSGRLYLVWYDAHEAGSSWPSSYREEFTRRTQGLIGYEFSAPIPGVPSGRPRRPDEREYQTSLLQLTTALAKYLDDCRKKNERPNEPATDDTSDTPPVRSDTPTVLVAQAAPDRRIRKKRRDLTEWCRNAGLAVLGENSYSSNPLDFKAEFAEDLQRAHLLVQLLADNWLIGDENEFPQGIEIWQQQQALKAGVEIIQWRDRDIKQPDEDERRALDKDELRHLDLIFGSNVITADPAELHRLVVERAQSAFYLGRIEQTASGQRSLLVKVTMEDYRAHEAMLLEIGNQALCSFAHNGRSVVERYRRRKFDAVVVVLGEGCTQDWRDDREEEFIESCQSFRGTGPVHAWFDTGTFRGAPPLLAPGILLVRGSQELRKLVQAIVQSGGTK